MFPSKPEFLGHKQNAPGIHRQCNAKQLCFVTANFILQLLFMLVGPLTASMTATIINCSNAPPPCYYFESTNAAANVRFLASHRLPHFGFRNVFLKLSGSKPNSRIAFDTSPKVHCGSLFKRMLAKHTGIVEE